MNQDRVFAFIAFGNEKYEYDNTCPVILPPWAQLERVQPEECACGHLGCDAELDLGDPDLVKCISCCTRALCLQHAIEGTYSACHNSTWNLPDPHTQTGATQGAGATHGWCPTPYRFLIPVDGSTLFATCESRHPIPITPNTEPISGFKYCLMSQLHANARPLLMGPTIFLWFPLGHWLRMVASGGLALPPSEDSFVRPRSFVKRRKHM